MRKGGRVLRKLSDASGISLYELLAAIVILGIVVAAVTALTVNAGSGLLKLSARETALQQSRSIMSDIVKEVKKGRVDAEVTPASSDDTAPTALLRLKAYEYAIVDDTKTKMNTEDYVLYRFEPTTHTLSVERKRGAQTLRHTFSDKVASFKVQLSENDTKLALTLVMQVGADKTYTTSTSLYLPNLN